MVDIVRNFHYEQEWKSHSLQQKFEELLRHKLSYLQRATFPVVTGDRFQELLFVKKMSGPIPYAGIKWTTDDTSIEYFGKHYQARLTRASSPMNCVTFHVSQNTKRYYTDTYHSEDLGPRILRASGLFDHPICQAIANVHALPIYHIYEVECNPLSETLGQQMLGHGYIEMAIPGGGRRVVGRYVPQSPYSALASPYK